ncbi:MAG: type II toxin-antitoxin system HicA family toxin [Turicibacter sp.]|nr:type II toxin-antitoxin system HicA family toxin [Turicibacter sp.]
MADYTKPLRDILGKNGWKFCRHGKGSHDVWIDPNTNQTVSVPIKIKSKQTANSILKRAKITQKF